MSSYNEQFLEHLVSVVRIAMQPVVWVVCGALAMPLVIIYFTSFFPLFALLLIGVCFFARSLRLGSVLGAFIVAWTVFLYFLSPTEGHFIEYVLKVQPRYSTSLEVRTSAEVIRSIPDSLSGKAFVALIAGIWAGGAAGAGAGLMGRVCFGRRVWMD